MTQSQVPGVDVPRREGPNRSAQPSEGHHQSPPAKKEALADFVGRNDDRVVAHPRHEERAKLSRAGGSRDTGKVSYVKASQELYAEGQPKLTPGWRVPGRRFGERRLFHGNEF